MSIPDPPATAVHDPSHAILFEPVRIGPLVARNRFFQVPHCNGMGHRDPSAQAQMRRVKAEGGWAVVCTEEVEIHPSSDVAPYVELRIWDDDDLPALARIAEAIHDGGALAGIELAHNGLHAANLYSRATPLGPGHLPVTGSDHPVQARAMTREDIVDLRRWHRAAIRRALRAGYDLVYVYAGHGLSVVDQFLSPRYNDRTDEYGGSTRRRMRLLRELLADAAEEVAGRAAVACRLTVDEGLGPAGIERGHIEEVLGELGELPDLWDFVPGTWEADSTTSRFAPEGDQERYLAGLKRLTSKPVVGVGRFTSPEVMVRQIRTGVLDLVGAARPSIADPFLPEKIRQGRLHAIRECIGCNVCVSGDFTATPIRCTQNPSMGEEFRRGWHPERLPPRASAASVLVVGAGPAGLEAARALGGRGYPVTLAEAGRDLGGRVLREARLPGLAAWIRVRDHRALALAELEHVQVYRSSTMSAADVLDHGFEHVAVATGATWRRDGVARWHTRPIPVDPAADVLTPDDLMAGRRPRGRQVMLYDDDHYYLGGVLAERLAAQGYAVELITPAERVSAWTVHTLEATAIARRLHAAGVRRRTGQAVTAVHADHVELVDVITGEPDRRSMDGVVLVTARLPEDGLYQQLLPARADGRLRTLVALGDAWAPGTIAAAVWSGRRFAEEFDAPAADPDRVGFRREVTALWSPPAQARPGD